MKAVNLLFTFTILIAPRIQAQIIHVPTGQPTIQAGIIAADDGDTVLVEDGLYYENITFRGKAITVASHFLIDGDTNHIINTIINGSQAVDSDSAAVVMFAYGEDTTSILCGFTITGGSGMFWDYWGIYGGGGIVCSRAGAKIVHNRVINNAVTDPVFVFGGGIACDTDNGEDWIIIEDNVISNNSVIANSFVASSGGVYIGMNARIRNNIIEWNMCSCPNGRADGGGIRWDSEPSLLKIVVFDHNVVRNNLLQGDVVMGGGVMVYESSTVISENIISGNNAHAASYGRGAGIFCMETQSEVMINHNTILNNLMGSDYRAWGSGISTLWTKGKVIIAENLISNNILSAADSSMGAGIMIGPQGIAHKMLILNNEVIENVGNGASHGGGVGCYLDEDAVVVFDGNVIKGNKALNGGGICMENHFNVELTNNIFALDTALSNGGAICLGTPAQPSSSRIGLSSLWSSGSRAGNAHPFFCNNTFVYNHASFGGAVYSDYGDSYPVFVNSLFWDNDAVEAPDIFQVSSPDLPVYYCNIDTNEIAGIWSGEENIFQDPLLCDELFHISWWDSPCWDAGIDQVEIDGVVYYAPDHDFEGEVRPGDATADIGADEDIMWVGVNPLHVSGCRLQVFPNPTGERSNITYHLNGYPILATCYSSVDLTIYDITGKKYLILVDEEQAPGEYTVQFDASALPAGIYLIRMQAGHVTETQKLIVLRP
jgi:hypothetical protein